MGIERMLNTIIVALEVLTGICAGIEDAEDPVVEEAEESVDDGESSHSVRPHRS